MKGTSTESPEREGRPYSSRRDMKGTFSPLVRVKVPFMRAGLIRQG